MRNYTSIVAAEDSIAQIERKLIAARASHIMKEYDAHGTIVALSFTIIVDKETLRRLPVTLPASVASVERVLLSRAKPGTLHRSRQKVKEQAPKTAWKLMLDWLDVQLSLIEMGQAEAAQVFLPYVACGPKSFYQVIKDDGYRALPGLPAPKRTEEIEDAEIA